MANDTQKQVAHWFFAGVVTAAGAAVFWWCISAAKKRSERMQASESQGELDRLLLAAEADVF